jgi:uncharacterized membrane protein
MAHGYVQHGGGAHIFAWLLFLSLVALLIGLAVLVLTRFTITQRSPAPPAPTVSLRAGEDPQELVRLRYARGEIDRETFLQVSQDLGGNPPPV